MSMANDGTLIQGDAGLDSAARTVLTSLLEKGVADGVLVPRAMRGGGIAQALCTRPEELEDAAPFAPVMPASSAVIVSNLTKVEPSSKTIAVVLRPCELRALVELVKLKQASLDGLLVLGLDCPGTFAVKDYAALSEAGKDAVSLAVQGDEGLREVCRACTHFSPALADIVLSLYGVPENAVMLLAVTEKGKSALQRMELAGDSADAGARERALEEEGTKRKQASDALVERTTKDVAGLDRLLQVFSACILCHNCMTMCPVCYCRECYFESPTFDFEADRYLSWAEKKGGFRVPQGSLLFHLTRMNHMSFACVACGLCEQACPSDIPVGAIFKTVGLRAQDLFDYEPGRSLDEELPVATFKEEELEPR
jgi:formate dehydrogenase subunit beta